MFGNLGDGFSAFSGAAVADADVEGVSRISSVTGAAEAFKKSLREDC